MRGLALRFDGRPSPAQAWDIRFRVAAVGAVSWGVAAAPAGSLVFLALGIAGLLALARSTLGEAGRVVRSFLPFAAFFWVLGVAFEPTAAQAGFLGIQALRLVLLLLTGHFLFLAATPSQVTEGIRWYLGWLGPRRAWAAASMAGWALGSVPRILDQASGLLEAAALRGLTLRRHPLGVIKILTLGLLVRTVEQGADLAAALEVRGFGQEVPSTSLRARPRDGLGLAGAVLGTGLAWVLGAILTP